MEAVMNLMSFIDSMIKKSMDWYESDPSLGYESDFYNGNCLCITENLLKENQYTDLANIYETLGTLSRSVNRSHSRWNHTLNYICITYINMSCYNYYFAEEIEYAQSLAMLNYTYLLKEIKRINQVKYEYDIRIIQPYNTELLGDICSFFDKDKAAMYYNEARELFKKVEKYEQIGEICDYYFTINDELERVINMGFNTEFRFENEGDKRITQKEKIMKQLYTEYK